MKLPYMILAEQVSVPDSYFWYTLSLLLSLALIGIIWRFSEKVSATLKAHQESISTLTTIVKIQEKMQESQNDRLNRVEGVVFLVNYPEKNG